MIRIATLIISLLILQGCMSGMPETAAEREQRQRMGCALMSLSGNPNPYNSLCGGSNTNRINNTSSNTGSNVGLLKNSRPAIYSYPIQWNQLCPLSYGGKPSLGHKNINGQKVCQYG